MRAAIQKLSAPTKSSFIYHVKSSAGFRFNWHFHPEYELTLIVRSRGKRFVADNISNYQDGDLVLLGPNLPHTWQSSPDTYATERHKACVIQFQSDFLGKEFFDAAELRQVKELLDRSAQGLCFKGSSHGMVSQQIEGLEDLTGLQRLTAFLEVLGMLARIRKVEVLSSPHFVPSLHQQNHRRIDLVCQYINSHYQDGITQPEVARLAQLSPPSFSNFFKKAVGVTFVEYVNKLRISLACQLLIETELSVLEVCHRSGFNNLSNFNRRFLRSKGISPRKYRSEFRLRASEAC
ncbi:MAG: AraC family transcriptional regulator [Planctomycetales bacterium]|nr:AraC family transcriptional regulator [Planctomycetales bacterium]